MSAGNYQRTPIGVSLNRIAQEAVATALQQSGKALPCSVVSVSGQFVTVKFEVNQGTFTLPNVTIPIATSKYDWIPVQVGDTGQTVPSDVSLSGINGMGGGVPNLVQGGNLSALVFQPISNKGWTAANSNQRVVQGPAGVLLQDTGANTTINLTSSTVAVSATSSLTFSAGGHTLVINGSGISLDGILFATHVHTLVQTGTDDSGPVLP
jgi:hypothetical protein